MMRVEVFNAHRTRKVSVERVRGYVRKVARSAGIKHAAISVVFVGSKYSRRMNRLYLNHDFVTDVISFPLERCRVLEGEVYVNLDRARSQARQYKVSFANEVARLVIHGALHLVGYDDKSTRKAGLMKLEEDRQLRSWFN